MPQRNDPCPCGSGDKYKACCAVKQTRAQLMPTILVGAFVVIAGIVLALSYLDLGKERVVPPGYVWSEEHGHLHAINGAEGGHLAIPEDAVWDPDHGHFHDANGNPVGSATPTPESPPTTN